MTKAINCDLCNTFGQRKALFLRLDLNRQVSYPNIFSQVESFMRGLNSIFFASRYVCSIYMSTSTTENYLTFMLFVFFYSCFYFFFLLNPYYTHARCPKMPTGVSPDPGVRKADPLSDLDEEGCCSRDRGS